MNRPGVNTSEFWVVIISMVVALMNAIFELGIDGEELAVVFGLPASYVFSRGLAKMKTPSDVPAGAPDESSPPVRKEIP